MCPIVAPLFQDALRHTFRDTILDAFDTSLENRQNEDKSPIEEHCRSYGGRERSGRPENLSNDLSTWSLFRRCDRLAWHQD